MNNELKMEEFSQVELDQVTGAGPIEAAARYAFLLGFKLNGPPQIDRGSTIFPTTATISS